MKWLPRTLTTTLVGHEATKERMVSGSFDTSVLGVGSLTRRASRSWDTRSSACITSGWFSHRTELADIRERTASSHSART